jgi:predicted DNA-binding transcriptional regulator YafY
MKQRARLFAIAEYMRGRRTGVTAVALAERFGVTLRTIYRDLDALRDGGLPLRADRGRGGGYSLDRTYSLPPVNFTAREAAVLLTVGRYATEMRLLPFSDTLAAGLDKVRAALSASAQRELVALMRELSFVGVPALAAPPGVRRAIEQAWFERVPVQIRYRSASHEVTTRQVRITSLTFERGVSLLGCEDLARNEARQLRLDRIESATVLDAAEQPCD